MTFFSPRARLISSAIQSLRAGRDVVVRAFPAECGYRLREMIIERAARYGVTCWNTGSDDEAPIVRARAFGCVAVEVERSMPHEMRPLVLYDLSAIFERGGIREQAVRSVIR